MKKSVLLTVGWLLNILAAIILILFAYTMFRWQESAKSAYWIAGVTDKAKPIFWIGASVFLFVRWLLLRKSLKVPELDEPLFRATADAMLIVLSIAVFLTAFLNPNPWMEFGKDGQYLVKLNGAVRVASINELKIYIIRHNLLLMAVPILMSIGVFRNKAVKV